MHPALRKLMLLLIRARIRRFASGFKTLRGALLPVAMLLTLLPAIGGLFLAEHSRGGVDYERTRALISSGLFLLCVLNLLGLKPDSGITFQPAEVDMLFPGPFTRRQLLLYKFVATVLGISALSLLFSCYFASMVRYWIAGFVGLVLSGVFAMLFGQAAILIASTLAETTVTRGRKILFGVLAVIAAATIGSLFAFGGEAATLEQITKLWIVRFLLAPFDVFGRVVAAQSLFPDFVIWTSVATLMNAALAAVILKLDANFLETAATASRKAYERMQRARSGATWVASPKSSSRTPIPPLPRLGGLGPIFWRQLITAIRGSRTLVLTTALITLSFAVPTLLSGRPRVGDGAFFTYYMMFFMSFMMFPQMVRIDFRGDLDQIETLKALPLHPIAVSIGQILTPVLLLTFCQVIVIAGVAVYQRTWPPFGGLMLAFAFPANWVVYCLENLLFLLYPYRMPVGGAMDMQGAGRQVFLVFFRLFLLAVIAGIAVGGGFAVYVITGSNAAMYVTAWCAAAAIGGSLIVPLAWVYARFDPSMHAPP